MLNVIAPGAVSGASNPVLDLWTQRQVTQANGFSFYGLGAPFALSFQVFNVNDLDSPSQVFPASSGDKQSVDLTADRIDSVDGHYAAAWTVPGDASGRYQIRWFVQDVEDGPIATVVRNFDVLAAALTVPGAGSAYALVSDLRDEGVGSGVKDSRILSALVQGSRFIERITRRSFRPIYKSAVFDGSGGRMTMFDEPLIALVGVFLGQPPVTSIERETFRIYNRHLVNGMISPDDRDDPKIEFVHFSDLYEGRRGAAMVGSPLFGVPWRDHYFPSAVQNVTVRGLWGYTDFDGSGVGSTPELIAKACKLLALRELPKMTGLGAAEREEARARSRLTSERTRDQSYNREAELNTAYTGDREIDDILDLYLAPPQIGSA